MGLLRHDGNMPYSDRVAVLESIDTNVDGMANYEEVTTAEGSIAKAEFQSVDVENSNLWKRQEGQPQAAQSVLSRMN
jgi:hypothetical protein